MRREEKSELIQGLAAQLGEYAHYYVTDISGMNADKTAQLRRACFEKGVKLVVVKNTLFAKALEAAGKANDEIEATLVGSSSIMFANSGSLPAKLIKEFRKKAKSEKPLLKSAYVEECAYIGESQLKALEDVKSREQLIGEIVGLLQSPAKNVISALQANAGHKIAGLVKTLQERN